MSSVINSLPPDTTLPPEIGDGSAWYGPDLKGRTDWIERLSATEIAEVESATRQLAESSVDLTSISTKEFPLPTLGPSLRRLLEEVLSGRGFGLIKAPPVERWTRREAAISFFGVGGHLGSFRSENADGHLLWPRPG